jgi:hypothetical protein
MDHLVLISCAGRLEPTEVWVKDDVPRHWHAVSTNGSASMSRRFPGRRARPLFRMAPASHVEDQCAPAALEPEAGHGLYARGDGVWVALHGGGQAVPLNGHSEACGQRIAGSGIKPCGVNPSGGSKGSAAGFVGSQVPET